MFFKIPAKSLRCHMRLPGYIFQGYGFVVMLDDIIVDTADLQTFMFAVLAGFS